MRPHRSVTFVCLTAAALALWGAAPAAAAAEGATYGALFEARFRPDDGAASARITIEQATDTVRRLRFSIEPERHRDFSADGRLTVDGDTVTWWPPADGGALRYTVRVDHCRRGDGYDARLTDDWALVRADDLFPPAAVLTTVGAHSRSRVSIAGPEGWSVETPYGSGNGTVHPADNPERRFDRPIGWLVAGTLGVRRDTIAGRRVSVAAPVDQGFRRVDVLALLNWTLPELVDVFPDFPDRLLIVGAGDPMWRGGLSGPASLYLHADRPLLSGNGTSTVVHELFHVATGLAGRPGADWIVEGLAEYYALEVLRRSGTISAARYARALESLAEWGGRAEALDVSRARGPVTARAVTVFAALDAEIRARTAGRKSLDDVARALAGRDGKVSLAALKAVTETVIGRPADTLEGLPLGAA